MTENLRLFWRFVVGSARLITSGGRGYYIWIGFLALVIVTGIAAYVHQASYGLITSNMRDQVSWGFYIGNFAYLVGVAAAAVVLVIPAYVYDWKPIKEVVLLGELLAIAAIVMCILFVTVDLGRPERIWHLLPIVGNPNFPYSLLVWDILVLNAYFLINYFIVTYLLFKGFTGQRYNPTFILPVIFLSIPLAISIHTVTAFLFMGLKSRPFWHTAILAPRFLASAFCSGPALLLLIFQIVRRVGKISILDAALQKIGELLAYAMAVNLFFLGTEVFAEFYSETAHSIHAQFQWFGIHGRMDIAIYTWLAFGADLLALIVFMVPVLRRRLPLLSAACVLAVGGVFIEKGMGLLLPGMTPDMMGEVYAYHPSTTEVLVGAGVWGVGALVFTWMARVAMAITKGEFRYDRAWRMSSEPVAGVAVGG
ncbi:MAG: sulfate reduction electron transfer complex DsrMKJOP subunit DsrP [Myxococcota bacterium]